MTVSHQSDSTARALGRRVVVGAAAAALAVGGAVALAGPAGAAPNDTTLSRTAPTGWLRVAHLSPGTPAVDIYLTSLDGKTDAKIRKAAYGSFTSYQSLPPGVYAVAMRLAGAPASSAPVVSWSVDVKAGAAYTVAAVGQPKALMDRLITDDLTTPPSGDARVRLIQGAPSAQQVTVSAVQGPVLAQDVPYGATTGYANVPQGRWTLKVTAAGKSAVTTVDVKAGGVYSLVVVQGTGGALKLSTGGNDLATGVNGQPVSMKVTEDAAAKTAAVGGVDTGFGGAAPNAPSAVPGGAGELVPFGLAGVALAAGAGVALRRRAAQR